MKYFNTDFEAFILKVPKMVDLASSDKTVKLKRLTISQATSSPESYTEWLSSCEVMWTTFKLFERGYPNYSNNSIRMHLNLAEVVGTLTGYSVVSIVCKKERWFY